jgi:hypothetical protein
MMGLGIFFSLLVGCGLMALVFYRNSNVHERSENPISVVVDEGRIAVKTRRFA